MPRPVRRPGNLPAETTSFIGRRRELIDVRVKFAAARLVSLVGPGGVGKTRLAIRAATELARAFPGGVWLVELADVRDPALVGPAVLGALDLRAQAAIEPIALLLSYLRDKRLLLIVDNCEHVLEPAARLLTEILRTAPGVCVLATSREPLSVPGEHVIAVPPLELPSSHTRESEAVRLFVERSAAASGRFELTAANQAAVAELCCRLDGLPLAIELAAVRTRVLSVPQILSRLSDRFGLLTGGGRMMPRHQTLRTTIDWSHDQLTGDEQALLRRLCVFAGRFTVDDVESVGDGPVLDLLASLVDKSLVLRDDLGDVAGYRLHETMREYASLKLAEAGETDAVERRCAEYYRDRCRQTLPRARYRLAEWLDWMDLEIDNVRAVLQRCVANRDQRLGLDLVSFAGWFWVTRATSEGIRWIDELLAGGEPSAHALAHFTRGFLYVLKTDLANAGPALECAAAAAQEPALAGLRSQALSLAAIAAHAIGDGRGAGDRLATAEAIAAGLDDYPATIACLQARALIGLHEGDLDSARPASLEGVRRSRAVGDLYALEMMLLNLGSAELMGNNLDAAKPLLTEALRIARRIDDRVAQYALLDVLACHAAESGQPDRAAQLIGAAETVQRGIGGTLIPFLAPLIASTRAALGDPALPASYQAGRALSRAAAIGLALGESTKDCPPDTSTVVRLSKREREVAGLIAEGLSNKQIGARLLISEHTVDSHVRKVLTKLGVHSRAQVAAWLASI